MADEASVRADGVQGFPKLLAFRKSEPSTGPLDRFTQNQLQCNFRKLRTRGAPGEQILQL